MANHRWRPLPPLSTPQLMFASRPAIAVIVVFLLVTFAIAIGYHLAQGPA